MIVNKITLKEFRQELGLSQTKMAERLGISRQFYNGVESGKKDISEALKVTIQSMKAEYDEEQKHYSERFKEQREMNSARLKAEEEKKEFNKEITANRKAGVFCPKLEPAIDMIWLNSELSSQMEYKFKDFMQYWLDTDLRVDLITQMGNGVKQARYQWKVNTEEGLIYIHYGFVEPKTNKLGRRLTVQFNPNKVTFENKHLIELMGFLGSNPKVRKLDICKDFYGIDLRYILSKDNGKRDIEKVISSSKGVAGGKTIYFGDMNNNGVRVYDKRAEILAKDGQDIGYDCARYEYRMKLPKAVELSEFNRSKVSTMFPVLVAVNREITKDMIGQDVDINLFCNLKLVIDGVLDLLDFDKKKRSKLKALLDGMATATMTLTEADCKIAFTKFYSDYVFCYECYYGKPINESAEFCIDNM